MQDPYEVLGVRRNASATELELAYKARRSQYHPDRYASSDAETVRWATQQMQAVNAAYALLCDADQRARLNADGLGRAANTHAVGEGDTPTLVPSLRDFLLNRFAPYGGFSRTYFAPNIPLKKLSNALQSYGQGLQAQDVIALMDTTVFGGAKEGLLLTEAQIRLKNLGDGRAIWKWSDIQRIDSAKIEVYINGHKLLECLAVQEGEVGRLVGGLQEFLQLRAQAPQGQQGAVKEPAARSAQPRGKPPLADKYRNMYAMAKREFLALCDRIEKLESSLGGDVIDRANAAEYFEDLEEALHDPQDAELAWSLLGEIAILSRATVAYCDSGQDVPPALMQEREEDSQLAGGLRGLLRFLHEAVYEAGRQARVQEFFRR